jgi:RimJ/RimL family protein N-acetyltransferase
MTELTLHIPSEKELSYRGYLISNEATMSYNMGYGDNGGCTYHKTAEELYEWKIPERFYVYIQRYEDHTFIGEVSLHKSEKNDWFEMGIIIEAKYRGMGYSVPALHLLLEHAFCL